MTRFEAAKFIGDGACNPIAVAGSLHKYMLEMSRNGADHTTIRNDPALRMICHQLAFLMGSDRMSDDFSEYRKVTTQVKLAIRAARQPQRNADLDARMGSLMTRLGLFTQAELDAASSRSSK